MKNKYTFHLLAALSVLFCLSSCAKTASQSSASILDNVLAAWMRVNHSDRTDVRTDSGAYVISFDQGSGATAGDTSYVLVHYTGRYLSGDIFDTNREDLSEQLGKRDVKTYYGSDIWQLGQGYLPFGVEEALKGVRAGAHLEIALPVAASKRLLTLYNAFTSEIADNVIYEIDVEDVVDDIMAYQQRQMDEYRDKTYPGLEPVSEGFYFKSFGVQKITDSITDGKKINVRYVGRLMNGQVFDTNIEDTARHYRIYSSDTDYSAFELTYYQDLSQFLENNNCIEGFARALAGMNYTEKAETFFWSNLGYGAAGSKTSIPEYAPLRFELFVEDAEE